MTRLTITDAEGRAKEVKSAIRAFGVQHPLTLGTIAAVAGFIAGAILGRA